MKISVDEESNTPRVSWLINNQVVAAIKRPPPTAATRAAHPYLFPVVIAHLLRVEAGHGKRGCVSCVVTAKDSDNTPAVQRPAAAALLAPGHAAQRGEENRERHHDDAQHTPSQAQSPSHGPQGDRSSPDMAIQNAVYVVGDHSVPRGGAHGKLPQSPRSRERVGRSILAETRAWCRLLDSS
mmetsp:Transcript_37911/g.88644  ORF Transcript_37911/g.88644 Transcript_37911/m.88644 type:complete len:182 (+) Transcript_37911:225-770(+)